MNLLEIIRIHLYGENKTIENIKTNRASKFTDPSPALKTKPLLTMGGYKFEMGLIDVNPNISNEVRNIDVTKVKIK